MRYCRRVRVACAIHRVVAPLAPGTVVKRGMEFDVGCRVAHASPEPCVYAPGAIVEVVRQRRVEVERKQDNIVVYVGDDIYVYPGRVWQRLERRLLRFLGDGGRRMYQQGVILYGPPGTGKTSMARIIAEMYGLDVVPVTPDKVLSSYMGESEARLAELLNEAETREPAMVLLDDAEWLAGSRATLQGGDSAARGYLGMLQVLFDMLQKWNTENRRVIGVLTTNVSEAAIDPALRRGGRLGRPIYVPLPDTNAVRLVLQHYGVDEATAEEYAVRIVNAGLPMSDVVSIAQDLAAGEKPAIEPLRGAGYIRHVPVGMSRKATRFYRELAELLGAPSIDEENPAVKDVLAMVMPEPVAIAVAAAFSVYGANKPVVVAVDPRYVDEAVEAAEATEAYLIVPAESFPPESVLLAYRRAKRVILAGQRLPSGIYALKIRPEILARLSYDAAEVLTETVARYYTIPIARPDIERLTNLSLRELAETLAILSYHPVRESKIARLLT